MLLRKPVATVAAFLALICVSVATAQQGSPLSSGKAQAAKPTIKPGTALAKLITESGKSVGLLAAHQTAPQLKIDIPIWLRAHYRRNHSEILATAQDPTGGFPLVLESLYVWMLHHQDLQPSPPVAAAAATKAVTVGQNYRISGQQNSPRSESDIRINLKDPKQIIAASNNIAFAGGRQAQFYSKDGGVTWGQTQLPLLPGDSLHSDPTVDWTSDGTAWATTIGISAGSTTLQLRAYKSGDGGQTWTFDGTFSGNQVKADKQMMWVDRSPTSPFRDTIYVIWHNDTPAYIARRTSAGWQPPLRVSGGETTGTAIGSDITTNNVGDVFAAWPDTVSQQLFFVKSVNGGSDFTAPKVIGKTFGTFQVRVPAFAERAALIGVSIAAFHTPARDDVYISWIDLSGRRSCASPDDEPATDIKSGCTSRVWFSRSTDGGKTWDSPKKINDPSSLNDQFNQKLAVDPVTGTLGIIYYDTAADNGRKKTNLMFQASVDNGGTWSPSTTVTSSMTDETTVSADNGNQYGDYNGLTVSGNMFLPSWTDRRDNKSEAIYSARIIVTKDATGNAIVSLGH